MEALCKLPGAFHCSLEGSNISLGCCPANTMCSTEYHCVTEADDSMHFISTARLTWVNTLIQLATFITGLCSFLVWTFWFRIRRHRITTALFRTLRVIADEESGGEAEEMRSVNSSLRDRGEESVEINLQKKKTSRRTEGNEVVHRSTSSDLLSTAVEASPTGFCCGCVAAADCLLLPCEHLACCTKCADHINTCPYCRVETTSHLPLFTA